METKMKAKVERKAKVNAVNIEVNTDFSQYDIVTPTGSINIVIGHNGSVKIVDYKSYNPHTLTLKSDGNVKIVDFKDNERASLSSISDKEVRE